MQSSGHILATSAPDDLFFVKSFLQNQMTNAIQLQVHLGNGEAPKWNARSLETVYISVVCVLDDLQQHQTQASASEERMLDEGQVDHSITYIHTYILLFKILIK